MVIEDYKTLHILEKWCEIWQYGHFLATVQTSDCNISLYTLYGFYVEVISDPISNKVLSNRAFENEKVLEKYLAYCQQTGNANRHSRVAIVDNKINNMFDPTLKIYKAKFIGAVTTESLTKFINETVTKAFEYNCKNLVHDMREANFQLSFLDEHNLFKEMLESTNLTHFHKVAVIVDYIEEKGAVDYGQDKVSKGRSEFADFVGTYYGQKIWEFFENYDKGIQWLIQKNNYQTG